ncbi:MAG: DUF99 family protein [Comamonadaceae bacterium]|nr:DUF99 family protein [Comamonadaceae bacterium]
MIGFDDAPFDRAHRGDVAVIEAGVCRRAAGGRAERPGAARRRNSTRVVIDMVRRSRFRTHLQAVLLQGIAFAGFGDLVDIHALHAALGVPVILVARHRPDMAAIRRALLSRARAGRASCG